jgi:hypothetical protein
MTVFKSSIRKKIYPNNSKVDNFTANWDIHYFKLGESGYLAGIRALDVVGTAFSSDRSNSRRPCLKKSGMQAQAVPTGANFRNLDLAEKRI